MGKLYSTVDRRFTVRAVTSANGTSLVDHYCLNTRGTTWDAPQRSGTIERFLCLCNEAVAFSREAMIGSGGFVEYVVRRRTRSSGSVEGSVLCGDDRICDDPVERHSGVGSSQTHGWGRCF